MEIGQLDYPTLWAMRQLLRGSEVVAARDRHEIEAEMGTRMAGEDASTVALGAEMYLTQQDKTKYEWNAKGVQRLQEFLVGGNLVSQQEWDRAVSWTPKVNGTAVRKWRAFGGALKALVDQARLGTSGKSSWEGPTLEELQKKLPDVVAEASGKLP